MRSKKGVVVSNKQDKTLVVEVHTYKAHPKYKKNYRVSRKFHVHNPENKQIELGEEVEFFETRPISKLKKWTLIQPQSPVETK